MEEIQLYLEDAKESMDKMLNHLAYELNKLRAGKAQSNLVEDIMVEYYGAPTPMKNCAAISTPDARTISIKPFEKNILKDIEKSIINSNIGLNPNNDGETIRLSIPPLTEERRKDLVKQVKKEGEENKVRIRNVRKATNEDLRKLIKDGAAEDAIKDAEARVQKLTDSFIAKVDEAVADKEQEILKV